MLNINIYCYINLISLAIPLTETPSFQVQLEWALLNETVGIPYTDLL